MKSIFCLLVLSSFLFGCGSYVNKMHREFDRADGKQSVPRYNNNKDQFDFYRNRAVQKAPRRSSSTQNKVLMPQVKRNYQQPKRVKADDMNDNGSSGSLWVGSGEDNFLFTNENKKSNGDIVLIDVESRLKNEITAELKRAFPDRKKPSSAKGAEKTDKKEAEPSSNKTAAADDKSKDDEVFDRISSIVVEEINKDHLLLRGRKFLLFKNRKRLIEIQALVPRREITPSDTVSSVEIIESSVNVIR